MNPILNYTIQFIIGGSIIVGMSILAKYAQPKYAALLYALPIQFTLAAIFIYLGTKQGTIQNLAKNSVWYSLAFVAFIVAFYLLTLRFNFWLSLGISYLAFIVIIGIILRYVKI